MVHCQGLTKSTRYSPIIRLWAESVRRRRRCNWQARSAAPGDPGYCLTNSPVIPEEQWIKAGVRPVSTEDCVGDVHLAYDRAEARQTHGLALAQPFPVNYDRQE